MNEKKFAARIEKEPRSLLIDVREPNEFQGGYITGAKNIPLSQLKNRLGEIPKDRSVLLYCRSKQAAKVLAKSGYSNLAHLQGGIRAWKGKMKK